MHPTRRTLDHGSLAAYAWVRSSVVHAQHRLTSDERGEGVISAAIVVLIMAFLGAAMWVAFNSIFKDASSNTSEQVGKIGS
ncbi:hypothetical protein PO878_13945 [Iamia majanohamensis]|jgi:hypothetical protein|uniref:Uncharacterized protein n=1 Tax=Iamia majanohamensis TaxID=467976 RepID=A0AAF0BSQ1_9ACTN|nr:hypothetical protein [Iamia majanohamensis]WCO65602.1 hypothetical protein PO878_13945 [Iamia majanohamensis]